MRLICVKQVLYPSTTATNHQSPHICHHVFVGIDVDSVKDLFHWVFEAWCTGSFCALVPADEFDILLGDGEFSVGFFDVFGELVDLVVFSL